MSIAGAQNARDTYRTRLLVCQGWITQSLSDPGKKVTFMLFQLGATGSFQTIRSGNLEHVMIESVQWLEQNGSGVTQIEQNQ